MLASLCIFCAVTAEAFHYFLGEPSGSLAIVSVAAGYLWCSGVALWIQADAVHRGAAVTAYDFDSLVFLLSPLVAPIYLFRTRGWGAFGVIGLFLLLQLGGLFFAALLSYPYSTAYFHGHQL